MVDFLPIFVLITVLLAVSQIVLVLYLQHSEKAFLDEMARAFGLPGQEKRNWGLWHRAFKKSQNILGEAELKSVKMVGATKYQTEQLEHVYEDQLRLASQRMEKQFGEVVGAAQQEFGKFLAQLKDESRKTQDIKDKELAILVGDGYVAFTKRLEEKLSQVEEEMLKISEKESGRVKEEIEQYKKTQMARVDENMAEILDRVVVTVLGRKLTTDDQTDLIVESLEQAKKEKFVI